MRLTHYITESTEIDKIVAKVKKDCKPFFKKMGSSGELLYRGSKRSGVDLIQKITPRKTRQPLDTERSLHDYLDKLFKKYHGWKARSEAVFVTPKFMLARNFGKVYFVFPIGDFKFLYNPNAEDLVDILEPLHIHVSADADPVERRENPYWPRTWSLEDEVAEATHKQKQLLSVIKAYRKTNLSLAAGKDAEIMLNCKSYYMVNAQDGHLRQELEYLFLDMTEK